MGLQPGNTWVPCIYSQGIDILYAASPAPCMFEHLKSLLLFLLSGGLGFHSVRRIITLLFPFHTLYQGMAHGASPGSSVRLWEREFWKVILVSSRQALRSQCLQKRSLTYRMQRNLGWACTANEHTFALYSLSAAAQKWKWDFPEQ